MPNKCIARPFCTGSLLQLANSPSMHAKQTVCRGLPHGIICRAANGGQNHVVPETAALVPTFMAAQLVRNFPRWAHNLSIICNPLPLPTPTLLSTAGATSLQLRWLNRFTLLSASYNSHQRMYHKSGLTNKPDAV